MKPEPTSQDYRNQKLLKSERPTTPPLFPPSCPPKTAPPRPAGLPALPAPSRAAVEGSAFLPSHSACSYYPSARAVRMRGSSLWAAGGSGKAVRQRPVPCRPLEQVAGRGVVSSPRAEGRSAAALCCPD